MPEISLSEVKLYAQAIKTAPQKRMVHDWHKPCIYRMPGLAEFENARLHERDYQADADARLGNERYSAQWRLYAAVRCGEHGSGDGDGLLCG